MSTPTNATVSQTTSLSELWNKFLQKYSSGVPPAKNATPKLSGARLDYARQDWVAQVQQQVKLGCQRFSWPETPDEVGALKDALHWDVAELWREVNAFFSIDAQEPNKRPDPGNTSYKTWQAENKRHEDYVRRVNTTPVQNKAQKTPVAESSRKAKGFDPDPDSDPKKPQSDNDEEDSSKDKPFTVLSPRLYGFTPKWFHKIWSLDVTDSKLKAFALKKWIGLMREFHAISKDYGEQTVLQMLDNVRNQESAEKTFARWDNYLQQLAARLYEDWEDAVRQWPKGDDDDDEAGVSTNTTQSNTDTDTIQTPTPALTPVQEFTQKNSLPFRQRRFVVVLEEDGNPVNRTKEQKHHEHQSKRNRGTSPTAVHPKRRAPSRADTSEVEVEAEEESSTEEEILYSRRSVNQRRDTVHGNSRTDAKIFQVPIEEKRGGQQYSRVGSNGGHPFVEIAPTLPDLGQRVPNHAQASRRGLSSHPPTSSTPKHVCSTRPPPPPLATKPSIRVTVSHPSMTRQIHSTSQRLTGRNPRHNRKNKKGYNDRHAAAPDVVIAPEPRQVESDGGHSMDNVSLDSEMEAEIEMIYVNAEQGHWLAFEAKEIEMEEGRLRAQLPQTVSAGEDSPEDTLSSVGSRSEDDMESSTEEEENITPTSANPTTSPDLLRIPATWLEENTREFQARRPASRTFNGKGLFQSESAKRKIKGKAVRWSDRPADVLIYSR